MYVNSRLVKCPAFQKAVDKGGEIQVTVPGVYEISEQIEIGDNTKLVFGEGVILRREASVSGINGNAFIDDSCKLCSCR